MGSRRRFSSDAAIVASPKRKGGRSRLSFTARPGWPPAVLVLRLGLALAFLAVLLGMLLLGLLGLVRGRRGGGGGRRRRGLREHRKRERGEHQDCDQLFHVETPLDVKVNARYGHELTNEHSAAGLTRSSVCRLRATPYNW